MTGFAGNLCPYLCPLPEPVYRPHFAEPSYSLGGSMGVAEVNIQDVVQELSPGCGDISNLTWDGGYLD